MSDTTFDLDSIVTTDDPEDDRVARISKADLDRLRDAAGRKSKDSSRVKELTAELLVYKAGLTDLTDRQRRAVIADAGETDDPAVLRASAEELGFVQKQEPDTADAADAAAHDALHAASQGAPPANSSVLTPDDVAGWPMDRKMRFAKEHPDEWESLKRGQQVAAP